MYSHFNSLVDSVLYISLYWFISIYTRAHFDLCWFIWLCFTNSCSARWVSTLELSRMLCGFYSFACISDWFECHASVRALPWHSRGSSVAVPWKCHGIALASRWHCVGSRMLEPDRSRIMGPGSWLQDPERSSIRDSGSGIQDPGSSIQDLGPRSKILDPPVRILHPGSREIYKNKCKRKWTKATPLGNGWCHNCACRSLW